MLSLFAPLVRPSFWISYQVQPFTPWVHILVGIIVLLLCAASVAVYAYRRTLKDKLLKRIWGGALACLISASISGLVIYFMTWQAVPVLGMRALWPIWFISHLAWGIWLYVSARKLIPAAREAEESRRAYEKWLPKAKK
jgi:hypothetical protein